MKQEQLEMKFNRMRMSKDDIDEAWTYLEAIEAGQSRVVKQGLLAAAIVAYSRPFKKSHGSDASNKICISAAEFSAVSERGRKIHDDVVKLRDSVVAHSDYDSRPVVLINKEEPGVYVHATPIRQVLESLDVDDFKELVLQMKSLCASAVRELKKGLTSEIKV